MEAPNKRTILLVDDEPDSLEPIGVLLEQEYHVLTATNGPEALDVLEGAAVEVIIADQRMPGMTGVELLAQVRQRYPGIVRLILTAYADFDAMIQAINEGQVYRYIIKPWDPEDMMLVVRQALDWKDLREGQSQLAAKLAEAEVALGSRETEGARAATQAQEKLATLGLAICRQVAELLGGTVSRDNTTTDGPSLTVRFPGEKAE